MSERIPRIEYRLVCTECGREMPYKVTGAKPDGTPVLTVDWSDHLACNAAIIRRGGDA